MNRVLIVLFIVAIASGCVHAGDSEPADTRVEPSENSTEDVEQPDEATDNQQVDSQTEEHTVYYTSEGFQPQQITIDEGDTVTWINNASQAMWVGSNEHPAHTEYDGTSTYRHCSGGESDAFDQCSEGDRYSFTFEKTGDWGYHNHRSALDEGTVVVE